MSSVVPAIEASQISGGYGGRPVVTDFTLILRRGEFVGLVGPNGAGKSTCLRLLTGALPLQSGQVSVVGRNLNMYDPQELAQTVAYVPQTEPALFDFTVREVVLMGRHPHLARFGRYREEDFQRVAEAMAWTDTTHLSDRAITQLSGGEHRRVLLARAIAQNTPVLVLDEPTAHLDMVHQFETLALMRRLCLERDTAVIAALHDLNAAADHCDRLVLLAHGRIVSEGLPHDVLTAERVREAYGGPVLVTKNPVTSKPLLLPEGARNSSMSGAPLRVHVVCGGGTGAPIMAELNRFGFALTAGVLNKKDSDETTATALGIPVASEEPFSPISDTAFQTACRMAREADAVVVTAVPLGWGNVRNLDVALAGAEAGARLVLLEDTPVEARDFTGGSASTKWAGLVERACCRPSTVAELLRCLMQFQEESVRTTPP